MRNWLATAWFRWRETSSGPIGWLLVAVLVALILVLGLALSGCAVHTTGTVRDASTGEVVYTVDLDGQPGVPKILGSVLPPVAAAFGIPPWAVSLVGLVGAGLGTEALRQHRAKRKVEDAYVDTVDEIAESGNPTAVEIAKKHQDLRGARATMRAAVKRKGKA